MCGDGYCLAVKVGIFLGCAPRSASGPNYPTALELLTGFLRVALC